MYCQKCGKELPNDALFCSGCGAEIKSASLRTVTSSKEDTEFTEEWYLAHDWVIRPPKPLTEAEKKTRAKGLRATVKGSCISMLICLAAILYSVITYANDTSEWLGYNYKPPLTNHEILVISFAIGGIVGFLVNTCIIINASKEIQELNKIEK